MNQTMHLQESIMSLEVLLARLKRLENSASDENLFDLSLLAMTAVTDVSAHIFLSASMSEVPEPSVHQLFIYLRQFERAKRLFEKDVRSRKEANIPITEKYLERYIQDMTEPMPYSRQQIVDSLEVLLA